MKQFFAIGDTHGKHHIWQYWSNVAKKQGLVSIHVGDAGFWPDEDHPPINHPHKFIRGNHDFPDSARKSPLYMGDWGYDEDMELFYISGADSHDKQFRTIGKDWWEDEQLTHSQLHDAIDAYKEIKPRAVISHDGPRQAIEAMRTLIFRRQEGDFGSRTSQALSAMYEAHQPDVWIFGHWHHHKYCEVDTTRFFSIGMEQGKKITY